MQSDANSNCNSNVAFVLHPLAPPARPPASLRVLFRVPPWGSSLSAPSEKRWIYVQQLSSKHIRRFRARLPVSAAVKHAGKSVVMSLCLILQWWLQIVFLSDRKHCKQRSCLSPRYDENWFLGVIKPTCFDTLLASVCEMMTYNFMDGWQNVKNTGLSWISDTTLLWVAAPLRTQS